MKKQKNTNITIIDEQKHTNLDAFASSTKGKGDVLLNSGSDANPLITEEQKNLISIALKLELQDILSKKTSYEPLIIEHVKKLINLCVRPFSDTLNIKDLSQGKWATIKEVYIKPQKSDANKIILQQVLSNQVNENILTKNYYKFSSSQ
ncbi:hypothetical protein RMONA_02590 [Rickettsia monacensis]|uniref:Uncharacterized protein n=1 Tax=Rickettsia monacensis TaxID=109232 RepID=A0A0B7IY99_9RICK|nr:hypothetical protein [Rickettsia monacensis]CDI29127.1 hypothetical protein RMONA_2290 [Rickettsia monacensis IrR/Munich]CEO16922.1 hypothetical protein RMONA_02590 [Rickettsia monacensis]